MMPKTKHMLVLAHSIKHWPGVCVAGREIRSGESQYTIGPWIRPVSSHGEGELSPSECQLSNGRQPRVMDFVEISLANRSNAGIRDSRRQDRVPSSSPRCHENWARGVK